MSEPIIRGKMSGTRLESGVEFGVERVGPIRVRVLTAVVPYGTLQCNRDTRGVFPAVKD